MTNKIIPLPPIGNSDHICLNMSPRCTQREPKTPQPRLNLLKGNYGKFSEDMQSIDWDTTLQGQPFTNVYRVFCNSLKEKTEQHISITTKQKKKQEPLYHPESKEPTQKKRASWDLYTKSNNPVDYARFAQLRNQLRALTRRLRACFEHNLAQDLKMKSKGILEVCPL